MNRFRGHIGAIEVSGGLSLVTVAITDKLQLKAIVIETPETARYLKHGQPVEVLFKETEVVVAGPGEHRISLQNRIPGVITEIEKGQLLSRLRIDTEVGELRAVISSNAVSQLGLRPSASVIAMIKLNETMLSE